MIKDKNQFNQKLNSVQKEVLQIISGSCSIYAAFEKILLRTYDSDDTLQEMLSAFILLHGLPCSVISDKQFTEEQGRLSTIEKSLKNYKDKIERDSSLFKEKINRLAPLASKAKFLCDYARELGVDGFTTEQVAYIVIRVTVAFYDLFGPLSSDIQYKFRESNREKDEKNIAELALKYPMAFATLEVLFYRIGQNAVAKFVFEFVQTLTPARATVFLQWLSERSCAIGMDVAGSGIVEFFPETEESMDDESKQKNSH